MTMTPPLPRAERLEIVRTPERLAAIEPAWRALWIAADGLVFQCHGWVSAWWSTVPDREHRRLAIGLVWQGDALMAVLPLATCRRKGLRFLEWAAASVTDYGDMLARPDCSGEALRRLWGLVSAERDYDLVMLGRLLPDAAIRGVFAPGRRIGTGMRQDYREDVSHRVVGDWATGEYWFGQQSKKTRKSYRHALNTLKEDGEVHFRLLPAETPLAPILGRIVALKRKWLEDSGRTSELFSDDETSLSALVNVLADTGTLRIFVLECGGQIVAVSVNFVQRNAMMAFVTTFDPAFARASPGMVLMMDYIRWSFDQGLTMVDFLAGDEAFKQRFATASVTLGTFIGVRTIKGRLARAIDRTRKSIRDRRMRTVQAPAASVNEEDRAI
jgi:CelD/BcsL family acetyltransferase involved in cellulose biosynthesis